MTEEILGNPMHVIGPLLNERADLPGGIAEFGVYAGRTTMQLAQFKRYVWAFDTFEGIPAEDFTEGLDRDEPGKFAPPEDTYERLKRHPLIIPVRGRFENTLPTFSAKIVLAYLDCDLYLSAKCALDHLALVLVPGGVIVLDDFQTHPGIRQAVNEFLDAHPQARFDGAMVIYWP